MKALIVLENHFYIDNENNVWCDRVVDYNYLKRYLNVFDSIILMGRCRRINKIEDNKLKVNGKNIEFVEMPDFNGAKGLLKNVFKLKRIIRNISKEADCVIYRAPTHLSLFTYKEVLKLGKPLGLEFMMSANKMFDGEGKIKRVLNKIIDKKTKKMCLKANGVSYVTEKILQDRYPCQAIVNGICKKYFTANYSSIDLDEAMYYKQEWNESSIPDQFKIVHIGYMDSYRKGQKVLLNAIKIVKEKGYDVTLTLIGDGEKRLEFENITKDLDITEIVDFKGLIKDKNDILEILRNSHFFVFPTQSEGLPRCIIEAMSQGLVCISSPVDGIPELLNNEFLIDYNDEKEYANKIIELINNWPKCCLESKNNYKKSLEYERKKLQEKRTDFYNKFKEIC